jgi:hypothetical protein
MEGVVWHRGFVVSHSEGVVSHREGVDKLMEGVVWHRGFVVSHSEGVDLAWLLVVLLHRKKSFGGPVSRANFRL